MNKLLLTTVLCAAVGFTGLISGCGKATNQAMNNNPSASNEAEKKSIIISGSTTVKPLAEELGKAFTAQNPNVTIDVLGGGSEAGIKSAAEGAVDLGASSSSLTEEQAKLVKQFSIATDGIAIIVNKSSSLDDITKAQLKDIYTGKVKNWKEIGGKDVPVKALNREDGSGTRHYFEEKILGKGESAAKPESSLEIIASTDDVKETVASTEGAIGFISLGHVDDTVKALKVEGAEPTKDAVKEGKYKLARPLILMTKDEPQGTVKEFIDFIYSSKGKSITSKDYIANDR